jgi:DNA-binding MarR family transcriptional regulator
MSTIIGQFMDKVNHSRERVEDDVMELVHRVMHQYRSGQYADLRAGPADITHMEGRVLAYVGRHPGATLSDLARHSGRDKAQLARLVKALRERALLSAEPDAADRRNVRLLATAAGQDVLRLLQRNARRLATRAMAGLDAAERAQLAALLQRVSLNLEAADD